MIRDGTDEAGTPKYAHVERERRWLIDPARRPSIDENPVLIEDRYITGTRMRLRRMTENASGKESLKLTKKYEAADPLARPIVTAYLTEAEYAVFARLPCAILRKQRFPLVVGKIAYSLDCFAGALAGLELAEIEWPDDAELKGLPPPPGAIREVSDDIRYQGGCLVRDGIPKDS